MSNNEKIVVEKVKKEKKIKKEKKPNKIKIEFYGVGKEFERTSWTPRTKLISDFFVVVIVVFILAAIFTGIALLMIQFL